MRSLLSIEVRRPHRIAAAIAVVGLLASAACSALLNRSTTECRTNADCLSLGVLPSCEQGACVNTGIACSVGTPSTTAEYENACTTSNYWSFDCANIGVCVPDGGPALLDPPPTAAPASGGDAGVPTATCASLAGAGAVYATGSSNFPTLLATVAPLLASGLGDGGTPGPAVVWQTSNSCSGVKSVYDPANGTPYMMQDPAPGSPASDYAQYYSGADAPVPCLLGDGGVPADVGESDVYPTTCPEYSSYTNVMTVLETQGPVQAMAFVVPSNSPQPSISAEAAREVFGTGGNDGGTRPWINPAYYAVRNQNTGTQQMIGKAIGVAANEFWGIQYGSSGAVADFISGRSTSPTEGPLAIGILSVAVYDADRSNPALLAGNMQALAFQATGQTAAYLPDSNVLSYDKQNVRDGHYPIWGPIHLLYPNVPGSAAVLFSNFFAGDTTAEPLLKAFISASLIPQCAMSVEHTVDQELAPLQPSSSTSCDCYFLQNATQAAPTPLPSDCVMCSTSAQCPSQGRSICNLGFCEMPGAH